MPRLSSQERFWKDKLNNPASTDAEKVKAAEELEKIKRRHTRIKFGVVNRRKKGYDPKPEFNEDEGYRAFWEKLAAWEQRHPEVKPASTVKVEQPKPESVIAAPIEPAPVKVAPAPKRIARPAPAPVDTFWPDFKSKPIYERNAILRTLNPARQVEWELMQEEQRLKAARAMAAMPKETPKPVSEIEKAAAFAPPVMIEPRPTGQAQTVDEVRETFQNTMGNATPDSGLSPELDRRGWLPDCKPEELTPSR